MIKYDPKHYDKAFQAPAGRWWSTLSINEMKALEKQHGTIGRATPQEVAAIYEAEVLVAGRTGCFTKKLNSGRVVLAKLYKGELSAVGYANRTQAQNKVDMLTAVGIKCSVVGRYPFYVEVTGVQHPVP